MKRFLPPASPGCGFARPALLTLALAAALPGHAANAPDLTAMSLESLMGLTVVAASKYEQKLSQVAAAVSVITRAEIKAFGWRTLDEAMRSLPGIHNTYDRQYAYIGARGFGLPGDYNARLLVTVNGNRQNDPIFDGGPFGRMLPLDLDLVERIEFIAGPGGAVYGQNAMLGVVNLVTRKGASLDGTELAALYAHPGAQREARASWGRKLDNGVDLLVSASAMRSRGADRFMDFGASGVSGMAVGLDGDRDREFFARVCGGPWSFDLQHGDRLKNDPTGTFFSDPLVSGQNQGDRYALAQLQYQDRFADGTLDLLGRVFAGRNHYSSTLSYGTPFEFPASGRWQGLELRLLSTALAQHKWMLGFEAQDNQRQDQAVLDRAQPANDLHIPGSGYRIGLYAQDEWQLSPQLTATLGLRADRNRVTGTKTSPRAALIWQASPATTLKALYGRAHRAPNAYERDYTDGFSQLANPALRGERIDTLEFIADHRMSRDLALRASLYQWAMHDLVTLGVEPISGVPQYQSGERIKARGLETSFDRTWGAGARLRGSLSAQDLRYDSGARVLNSPRLLAKLNLSAPLPWGGLRAGYELQYGASRLTADGSLLGGHAVSNLTLGSDTLVPGLQLSLTVSNLFDKHYAHPGADTNWQNALAQDGRSLRARVGLRF